MRGHTPAVPEIGRNEWWRRSIGPDLISEPDQAVARARARSTTWGRDPPDDQIEHQRASHESNRDAIRWICAWAHARTFGIDRDGDQRPPLIDVIDRIGNQCAWRRPRRDMIRSEWTVVALDRPGLDQRG